MTALDAGAATVVGLEPVAFRPVTAPRAITETLSTTVAPRLQPALERRKLWERRYRRQLGLSDTIVVFVAVAAAVIASNLTGIGSGPLVWEAPFIPVLTGAVWLLMLSLAATRDSSVFGSGATEYKRVVHATGLAFGLIAILFVFFEVRGVRSQLIIALPLGIALLMVERWAWRRWLMRQRGFGHFIARTIVTGTRESAEHVIQALGRDGRRGYTVVGAAVTDDDQSDLEIDGIRYPVVGSTHTVAAQARQLGADTVVVASSPVDEPDFIKRLSWQLEGTAAELVLSSRLADVAGPRMALRQVDGLPLIHVKIPEFEGGKHAAKRALDIFFSVLALIPVAIVTPFIALAIKLDDGGPVFFRQTRIGRDGSRFPIFKFRTMRTDAEARLAELQATNEGAGLLFKMKSDPRVTRVGAFLRKTSLDELPQFFNVLRGDMSIVGPRPPLPAEVTAYDGTVIRRLYIKPGITGLWQVSGRSDLSWDESVRLDLRYVENWSVLTDIMIMWRTVAVMLKPRGAY